MNLNWLRKKLLGYQRNIECGTIIYTDYCTKCGAYPNERCNLLANKEDILKHGDKYTKENLKNLN